MLDKKTMNVLLAAVQKGVDPHEIARIVVQDKEPFWNNLQRKLLADLLPKCTNSEDLRARLETMAKAASPIERATACGILAIML